MEFFTMNIKITILQPVIKVETDMFRIEAHSIGEFLCTFKFLDGKKLNKHTLGGLVEALNQMGFDVDLKIFDNRPFYENGYVDIAEGIYNKN